MGGSDNWRGGGVIMCIKVYFSMVYLHIFNLCCAIVTIL